MNTPTQCSNMPEMAHEYSTVANSSHEFDGQKTVSLMTASNGSVIGAKNDTSSTSHDVASVENDAFTTGTIWHDDHCDVIENDLEDEVDWINGHVGNSKDNRTNVQLYEDEATQDCLKMLSRLPLGGISALIDHPISPRRIPLFKDKNGDEYQINISSPTSLPEAICTRFRDAPQPSAKLLFHKGYKPFPPSEDEQTRAIPKSIIHLGSLDVSTTSRYPDYIRIEDRVTERTDYDVVVDIEKEGMPLWLVTSRRRLDQRAEGVGYVEPIPPLPIFDGLMGDLESSYDAACILPSIQRLGTREQGLQESDFQLACDLVRKTRAIIDPVVIPISLDS